MRGFLNVVFTLLVSGVALIALSPIIVLSLEIYQDPLTIGVVCIVSGDKVIAVAWYKGSLRIGDATLSASIDNTTIGSSWGEEISRNRNLTLEATIPEGLRGKKDLVISLSIKIENLYRAGVVLRGCLG